MNVSTRNYKITYSEQTTIAIGKNILKELAYLLKPYGHSRYFIIVDNTTKELFLDSVVNALEILNIPIVTHTFPQGEEGKTLLNLTNIFTNMLTNNIDKKGAVIALGGGVVGDVATLAAGLYLRGIDCIQIPTTLLAQVDSAIGGKGAVNVQSYKNMVGIIRQPRLVVADTSLLASLPKKQVRSGMGEIIKYALAFDKKLFSMLQNNTFASLDFQNIVKRSIDIKMKVVVEDVLDKANIRTTVNFGHTLGHAIEIDSHLFHGEAIAIGMAFAIKLSQKLNLLSAEIAKEAIDLIRKYQLPTSIKGPNKIEVLSMFSKDKKAVKGIVQFVLLKDIGQTVVTGDIPPTIIKETLSEVLL